VDLRGENFLFVAPLLEAQDRLERAAASDFGQTNQKTNPWYGLHLLDPERWRREIRRAMINQLYPERPVPKTIGFKEIRWHEEQDRFQLSQMIDFLIGLRPPGAVVFLTRGLVGTLSSAWWSELSHVDRSRVAKRLTKFEHQMSKYNQLHPDRSHLLRYEDFICDAKVAEELCNFLGVRFDANVWRSVLNCRWSF